MYITYMNDPIPLIRSHGRAFMKTNKEFRPTWLVRVSDMKRVPGTECERGVGYCALSYSWNFSGTIHIDPETGESTCEDEGKHSLVIRSRNGKKLAQHEETLVDFKKVVQQICKDFGVQYIWYDKDCINQMNKEEKIKEIKKMHQIYRNATYTVAMIPEMEVPESVQQVHWSTGVKKFFGLASQEQYDAEHNALQDCIRAIYNSEWSKRMWTLEECMLSKHIVYVGKNAYVWNGSGSLRINQFSRFLGLNGSEIMAVSDLAEPTKATANMVLRQAHIRNTTKEHDRVYALANIFADTVEMPTVNYKRPAAEVLTEYYCKIAAADLSILSFGKPHPKQKVTEFQKRYRDVLPSWTGINGMHSIRECQPMGSPTYSIKENRFIQITCDYWIIRGHDPISPKTVSEDDSETEGGEYNYDISMTHHLNLKEEQNAFGEEIEFYMSVTEDCDEMILLDVPLGAILRYQSMTIFPIIRKITESTYKAIGAGVMYTKTSSHNLKDFVKDVSTGTFDIE
ncbi:heterokaryon incompatibility protein-domain-containing protein [Fennellomyces sp. T-0311]|nr:heterokaryon incompatibility protein-domain-containing protein [Fennellomyces sp. T-0311]